MKHDVQPICGKCIPSKEEKSKVMLHGFYTPLFVPNHPWTNVSMDSMLGLPRSQGGRDIIFIVVDTLVKWCISLHVPKPMMQHIFLIFYLKK